MSVVNSNTGSVTMEQIKREMESASKPQTTTKKSELDKDAFLKLLMTQMQYQDPLNPMENTEFVAQLAQFTSLEQMNNLYKSSAYTQGMSMIGKEIDATFYDDLTKEYMRVQGVVEEAVVKNGNVYLRVDEMDVPLEKVSSVKDGSTSGINSINSNIAASQALTLIGKTVQAIIETVDKVKQEDGTYKEKVIPQYVEGKVDTVRMVNGKAVLVVGNKEISLPEVITVSNEAVLLGKDFKYYVREKDSEGQNKNVLKEGKIGSIKIDEGNNFYIVPDGGGKIDINSNEILNLSVAIANVGKEVSNSTVKGKINAAIVKDGKVYVDVNGEEYILKDVL